ncbi:hypothetical protein LTS18_012907 [Coniosporium uncinatum]|uniref:Uncharacterized protein n=1 Tax=Coniosporium uncinatum TaxID=93489 RepID=A0ACC3DIV7_9PEZI|nr:hypothetical protein LTS18_012907 [Coniosporium uncinatum]
MITFASVFLMKVATKWNSVGFNLEPTFVWDLVGRMIKLLKDTVTSDRHLLHHIAAGLDKMLITSRNLTSPRTSASRDSSGDRGVHHVGDHAHNQAGQQYPFPQGDQVDSSAMQTSWEGYEGMDPQLHEGYGEGADFDPMILNDSLLFEAFGSDPAYGVYNLLTSQFSG